MRKTAKEVQDDFYVAIKSSPVADEVTGGIYKQGYRPSSSELEDVTVNFIAGTADEVQRGVVAINIYVPDVPLVGRNGLVEDGARTAHLERVLSRWVQGLGVSMSNYKVALRQTVETVEASELREHVVVARVGYELYE